jgi:membrane protein
MSRYFLFTIAMLGVTPLASKILATASTPGARERPIGQGTRSRSERKSHASSFQELRAVLSDTVSNINAHNTSLLAAGVAFYALFALFPGLAAGTWIFGLLANPASILDQLDNLRGVLPKEAWQLIDQQLMALISRSTSLSPTGIVSLLVAIFSARAAASSMMGALNVVYGIEEKRSFVTTNAIAILFTLLAIVLLLIAVGVLVVAPIVFNFVGLHSYASEILRYARWPALAVLMILALALVYRFGPDRKRAHWKWITWGSATATVIWLIASSLFSWYVAAFNSYDKIYGSIGAVAVLLFWFWITAFAGLLGAELDNVIERRLGISPS